MSCRSTRFHFTFARPLVNRHNLIDSGTASNRGLHGVKHLVFRAGGSGWSRGFWYSRRCSLKVYVVDHRRNAISV
jgi:hypothetical protein